MRSTLPFLATVLFAGAACAQIHDRTTQTIWALDKGNNSNPTPVIRVYSPSGAELTTINVPGSGTARALAFDRIGNAYVCRGNLVHKLDPGGVDTTITLAPPMGSGNAQDVVEMPSGDILVSWGVGSADAAITTYDPVGNQLSNFTDPGLDHPRRITPRLEPTGTTVYVANRGGDEIAAFDVAAMPPVLSQIEDLSVPNVGPVGLCYDNANDALWVSGAWGQTNEIGCVDLSSNTWSSAISYPPASAPTLTAPTDLSYDRFRRLYVATSDKNMGTSGIYVFDAPDPTTAPVFLAQWPRTGPTPNSLIDVEPQPVSVSVCAPAEDLGGGSTRNVFVMGQSNRVTFGSPATPSAPFAAAFSGVWSGYDPATTANICAQTWIQGPVTIGILPPDVRFIPLMSDLYFWGSVGVLTPGPSPVVNPAFSGDLTTVGVGITGFLGDLDATGFEDGTIDLTAFNLPAMDGVELSLTFVTFDFTEPALFGVIANPVCVVLRDPALVGPVIPCP